MPPHRRHSRLAIFCALATAFLLVCNKAAGEIRPPPLNMFQFALQKGTLLIAHPRLADPRFRKTVILIIDTGATGAAGLIINRPTPISIAHVLPGIEELSHYPGPLYAGGPVGANEMFVLIRSDTPPPAQILFSNIFLGRGLSNLRSSLAALRTDASVRIYAGYAGWAAGQLEREIARGDWIVAPADGEAVFNTAPDALWNGMIKHWSGQWL